MEDAPPQLGNIPQYSEMNIPTLGSQAYKTDPRSTANGNASFQESVKNSEVRFDDKLIAMRQLLIRGVVVD